MELREGYKQTEFGVIPNDWEVKSLIDLCGDSGLVRGPFGGSLKKDSFTTEGIKVYEQKNAIYRNVDLGIYYIDEKKYYQLKRFEVFPRDFIVSCSGTIGRIFLIPQNAPKGIINQALLKIKVNDEMIDKEYFFYYFDWDRFQEKIIDNTQGGAMKNLVGMDVFRNTLIALPRGLREQAAIADALSDADALISRLEQLIAKKRNIKQGAMQELLTGKKRLPGFEKKKGYKKTNMGVIPSDWKLIPLGFLSAFITKGATPTTYGFSWEKDGVLFLRSECVSEQGLDLTQSMFISPEAHNSLKRGEVRSGDILITITGNVGRVIYLGKDFGIANTNQHIARIRITDTNVAADYVFHFLSQSTIRRYYGSITTGQAYPQISLKQVRSTGVALPLTKEEQAAIAQILSDMDAEIEGLEQKLDKYRMIKQGMMQELLTGKTRLI